MKTWMCAFLVCVAPAAFADSELADDFLEKKIKKGDWSIGGSAEFAYASLGGARITAAFDGQYFVADYLSLGVTTRLQGGKLSDASGIGVIGTYHFYESARSTFYVSASVNHTMLNSELYSSSDVSATLGTIGLGWNYFLTPNVAFGPRLEYTRVLGERQTSLGNHDYQFNIMTGFTLFF